MGLTEIWEIQFYSVIGADISAGVTSPRTGGNDLTSDLQSVILPNYLPPVSAAMIGVILQYLPDRQF